MAAGSGAGRLPRSPNAGPGNPASVTRAEAEAFGREPGITWLGHVSESQSVRHKRRLRFHLPARGPPTLLGCRLRLCLIATCRAAVRCSSGESGLLVRQTIQRIADRSRHAETVARFGAARAGRGRAICRTPSNGRPLTYQHLVKIRCLRIKQFCDRERVELPSSRWPPPLSAQGAGTVASRHYALARPNASFSLASHAGRRMP